MDDAVLILSENEIPPESGGGTDEDGLVGEFHREDKALSKLQRAWPTVMSRLRTIVEHDQDTVAGSFSVDTVEFGISVKAGMNFFLVSSATADAKIVFKRNT